MASIFSFPQSWRFGRVTFSRRELSQILSVYGQQVSRGEWRDYAIDCLHDRAMFSIFRHSHETPLYVVMKLSGGGFRKPSRYAVLSGDKTLAQSASLPEALQALEEQQVKNKK